MDFTVSRETLLKPLQMVAGTVERRQTLPILSNVLLHVENNTLFITGTDLEVELIARIELSRVDTPGETTLPARKFIDICRNLPDQSEISIRCSDGKATIKAGRSKFTLATLSADEFPQLTDAPGEHEFNIAQKDLRYLIETTQFSMAQNDVRYYLNGLLLQITPTAIVSVATDGHRLSLAKKSNEHIRAEQGLIIPRKGVLELMRLLEDTDDEVTVSITENHFRVAAKDYTYTSKLIDGRFPDYQRVIPKNCDKVLVIEKEILKNALSRVSILSNEKYRGVRFQLRKGLLFIQANNPEQEVAEEELEVKYNQDDLDIGFNVSYLLDVLNNLPTGEVKLSLMDLKSSLLIESLADPQRLYVVMPMRV